MNGRADVRNIASNRVMEKSGFIKEGTVRRGKMVSAYCDYNIYGMLREDYFGLPFRYMGKEGELMNRTMMVRDGGCIYYLTSQIRTDRENESKAVMDEIWRSLSWD